MSTNETQSVMVYSLGKRLDVQGSYPHYTNPQGEEYTPMEQREIQAQLLAERYLERDIVYCQTYLVEGMLKLGMSEDLRQYDMEDFSYDDIVNLYPDPEEWTIEQCREYLEDQGVDVEDLADPDPFSEWPSLQQVEDALRHHAPDGGNVILHVDADGWWDLETDDNTTPDGDYQISRVYADLVEENPKGPAVTSYVCAASQLLGSAKALHQKALDEGETDDNKEDVADEWRDAVRDNSEAAEIYEWWLVTDWLADKLEEAGEPVLRAANCAWWGRCVSGQSIILDGTLQNIAKQFLD